MNKVQHDSATPAHGQQVISAVAFIHHDFNGVTKVFMPKRADSKAFLPGLYEMIGGHIDFGEDIVKGLKREIMEEIGMKVSVGDSFACFTYMNNVKRSHSIEVVYFAKFIDPIDSILTNPEDHSGFVWFSREEVIEAKNEICPPIDNKDLDDHDLDPEYASLLKGFDILEGRSFATS